MYTEKSDAGGQGTENCHVRRKFGGVQAEEEQIWIALYSNILGPPRSQGISRNKPLHGW